MKEYIVCDIIGELEITYVKLPSGKVTRGSYNIRKPCGRINAPGELLKCSLETANDCKWYQAYHDLL